MLACRKARGAMAASLYEALGDRDQSLLDRHLAVCGGCRSEYEALRKVVSGVPVSAPELQYDLLPAVRRRLVEGSGSRPAFRWRYALVGAACVAVVALFASVSVGYVTRHRVQPPMAAAVRSEAEKAIEDATALGEKRDYPAAYRALKAAVETYPEDGAAGEAQRLRAELAFAHLHWYPEAYEDYQTLAESYPAVFRSSVESVTRRDLLAEAREQDYASLHALDAARRHAEAPFAQLEQVIARYPATFVASAAAEDLARLAAREVPAEEEEAGRHVLAMERARDRCTNPVAWAQLSLELGHIYCREMNAPGKAHECYNEAAESENPVLAQLARRSMAELESDGR